MRRIGASFGKRVAARNVPTVRQPAVARGMGTADPAGTMAGGIDAGGTAARIYAENGPACPGSPDFGKPLLSLRPKAG